MLLRSQISEEGCMFIMVLLLIEVLVLGLICHIKKYDFFWVINLELVVRRFFLYLIGVGLGVIVSIFFFGDRNIEFSYLPNARTLKHLRGQAFQFSEKALCQLNCISMTESSFEQIFLRYRFRCRF